MIIKPKYRILYKFYLPIFASVYIFYFVYLGVYPFDTSTFFQDLNYEFQGVKIPIGMILETIFEVKHLFLFVGILLLFYAFNMNVSSLYPVGLKFDIYFDVEGIKEKVDSLRLKEFHGINIVDDWESKLHIYDELFESSLEGLRSSKSNAMRSIPIFSSLRKSISGKGSSSMKQDKLSLNHYKFIECEGTMDFTLEEQQKSAFILKMAFNLKNTPSSHMKVRFKDLFPFPKVEISPECRQILSIDDFNSDKNFDHSLRVCSRLSVLPIPAYTDSVYLFEIEGEGYIPTGYCIYK